MRLVRPDLVTGSLDVAQYALGTLQQFLTAFGQPHAAVGAGKQRDVEFLLKALNMPGESRLRDMKMSRGAGNAAEFGDADKIVKAAQFHRAAI
jgi:hypothetical protein